MGGSLVKDADSPGANSAGVGEDKGFSDSILLGSDEAFSGDDVFRLSLTLFGKGMFFARTNGDHSSGAENADGLPNRNSHNARAQ